MSPPITAVAVVPTFRPNLSALSSLLATLDQSSLVERTIILDSSNDQSLGIDTVCADHRSDFITLPFPFDHGGARNFGASHALGCGARVVVFLTQDCLPCGGGAVDALVEPLLTDNRLGATTGRQIPHAEATVLEATAREVMYPETEHGRARLGLYGTSNSFAAYSLDSLRTVGGFPVPCAFGEDAAVSSRLVAIGREVRYVPNAVAVHSHDYTLGGEFRRFFDAGQAAVCTESQLYVEGSNRIGIVRAEFMRVWSKSRRATVRWAVSLLAKAVGYQVGKMGSRIPDSMLHMLSSSPHVLTTVRQTETLDERALLQSSSS